MGGATYHAYDPADHIHNAISTETQKGIKRGRAHWQCPVQMLMPDASENSSQNTNLRLKTLSSRWIPTTSCTSLTGLSGNRGRQKRGRLARATSLRTHSLSSIKKMWNRANGYLVMKTTPHTCWITSTNWRPRANSRCAYGRSTASLARLITR